MRSTCFISSHRHSSRDTTNSTDFWKACLLSFCFVKTSLACRHWCFWKKTPHQLHMICCCPWSQRLSKIILWGGWSQGGQSRHDQGSLTGHYNGDNHNFFCLTVNRILLGYIRCNLDINCVTKCLKKKCDIAPSFLWLTHLFFDNNSGHRRVRTYVRYEYQGYRT